MGARRQEKKLMKLGYQFNFHLSIKCQERQTKETMNTEVRLLEVSDKWWSKVLVVKVNDNYSVHRGTTW